MKKAKEKYNLTKVVVMYSNDDAFTESGFKVFEEALKAEGIQNLETITFSKADTDFRALLTQAKGQNPDALVVSGLIGRVIPVVQARELGITVPIIGGNEFNNPKLMADAGEAAEGVVVGAAWNSASANELDTAFLQDFQTKFNAAPDQFAAQAHAGLVLIDHAVRSGCSGERDAIRDGLTKISNVPTVLGEVFINANRDAEHPAVVKFIRTASSPCSSDRGPGRAAATPAPARPGPPSASGPRRTPMQQLLNGVFIGSIYALFAIGFTLVFGILDRLNLAHPSVFAVSAFVGIELVADGGLSIWLALPIVLLVGAVLGLIIERLAFRPLKNRPDAHFAGLISSIALAGMFIALLQWRYGPDTRRFQPV